MSSAFTERPVASIVSTLVDVAHQAHRASSSGRPRQPETAQYALFKWQLQEAAEAARSSACSSSSLGGMTGKTRRSSSPAGGDADADADAGPGSTISGAAERTIKRESTFASVVSFAIEDGGPPTPNLEVVCEFDANCQSADLSGAQGGNVRPLPQPTLGPITFLFRWYTKRATQFPPGFPAPEDLADAPAMLPSDPGKPPLQSRARTSISDDGPSPAGGAAWNEGLPPLGGHSLNRAPDPVMSAPELTAMLEELGFVPQCVSRQDVVEVFRAVMQMKCDPPNRLPSGQVRPDEIRFPQFCDALIRLALAADARAAVAAGAKPGNPHAAVASMMQVMEVTSPNLAALKRKLDALARMAGERGAQRNAIKWMYVGTQSAMEAARSSLAPIDGWSIDSPFRAPADLHDALFACDRAACTRYQPEWRRFPDPALNLGTVQPGEVRSLRLVLRNRSPNTMYLRIDTSAAEGWLTCAFKELPLPTGVPRVLDVQARFEETGEYTGSLQIYSRVKQEGTQCVNNVPFYAVVTTTAGPKPRSPGGKSFTAGTSAHRMSGSATTLRHSVSDTLQGPPSASGRTTPPPPAPLAPRPLPGSP